MRDTGIARHRALASHHTTPPPIMPFSDSHSLYAWKHSWRSCLFSNDLWLLHSDQMYLWRRSDGIVTSLKPWKQLAQVIQSRLACWQIFQNVNNVSIVSNYPLVILFFSFWGATTEKFQSVFLWLVVCVLCQFLKNVCSWIRCNVQIVRKCRSVWTRAWKWVLFARVLYRKETYKYLLLAN